MSKIKVLHAENKSLAIEGLKLVLLKNEIASDVYNIDKSEMITVGLVAFEPDLLIIDYTLENAFSIADIEYSIEHSPNTKVLIISDDNSASQIIKVLELGVHGYLTRCSNIDEILMSIRKIMMGEKYFCPKIIEVLVNKNNIQEVVCGDDEILTDREKEIVKNIALGNTNKQIGTILSISHHTVHTHRKNVMKKLGVKTSNQLTLYAVNSGLVELP